MREAMRRLNLASPKRLGRFSCGWWRHDGGHGFRSFRALARSAGKADFSGLSVAAFCRREVCVTRGTTSHGEAEMAKVSDDGILGSAGAGSGRMVSEGPVDSQVFRHVVGDGTGLQPF